MRPGYNQSPINPLPAVIWVLALPMIASELAFLLSEAGLFGGQGMRLRVLERAAFIPQLIESAWAAGDPGRGQFWRLVSYPFIQISLTQALFVVAFTLALGKMVAEVFRPVAVLVVFFGSGILAALAYTVVSSLFPGRFEALMGGYPPVYGLVGAFTFLLWVRLGQQHANQARAFTLIGMLLLFQLVFGLLFGGAGHGWVAEIAAFFAGFGLSFLLVPGGWTHAMNRLRRR